MSLAHVQNLVGSAPVTQRGPVSIDWESIQEIWTDAGITDPSVALAASWCQFGNMPIAANVDSTTLAIVFPTGIIASMGKRKFFGGGVKFDAIAFPQVRSFGAVQHEDPRGYGKFGIEFFGAGGVPLGRLQWVWYAKRFRDSRAEIMAIAEERDRILGIVETVVG